MDVYKYLIMIKGEDRTEEVISYESNKRSINIKFKNTDKIYEYSKKSFEFYKDPIEIDIENKKIIIDQGYVYNVIKLIKFDKYYKLFFQNGKIITVPEYESRVVENDTVQSLSTNKFEYYRDISRIVSVKTEEGNSLLTDEYEKINFVSNDTALYKYLNPKSKSNIPYRNLDNTIFPFGANKSQFNAVKEAMKNQISIIEGPPGTGKTQTILNIIANIIINGKTVAVVSNNNAATDNIYEKLEKYNLGYLCSRLGKKENKEEFIKNQTGEYPEPEEDSSNEEILKEQVINLNQNISKIFELQNVIAKMKEKLSEINLEHQYFNKHQDTNQIKLPKIRNIDKIKSGIIMKLKVEYEDLNKSNIWFRIKSQLLYGIGNAEFYRRSKKEIINCYNRLFFIVQEIELQNKIKSNTRKLKSLGNDKLELLVEDSKKLLNKYLNKKYDKKKQRKIYSMKDLYNNSYEFNREYPIVFSTTYSIKKCLNPNYVYDYIIMDESSQVDLITGALALSSARNAVIVGDLKQLPNVITTENKKLIEEISKKYRIDKQYDYLENSFLSSVNNAVMDAPRTLLREHYRCHPKIIQFCNKKFYDGKLIIMTEDQGEEDVLKVYITSRGNHARGHINYRQIDVIENEVLPELQEKMGIKNIGIISPYRDQKAELEKAFNSQSKIDTVHKFQGREEEAIIITTVDNEIGEFVDDPKLLNVAVSRAKRYLRLVVSDNDKNQGTNIDDLVKYIQYNNFEVIESKTKSIYDLLYQENRRQRLEYLKNKKRISEYDSENLTYNLIKEVIKEIGYNDLDVASRVPLMDILANDNLLNEEEKRYANNEWTHLDFVIFNKMDKKLDIAIEVDGYYYHKEGTKQQERDKLKNKILEKYDVPLIRFNTTGSGEKEILKNKIMEIFNN